jgi:MFS transporter, FHS family, Na+ dependent glucose transporter 1
MEPMSSNALAVSMAPPADGSLRRTWQTVGYFAAFVALGLTIGTFGPTLPGLAAQTGASLGGVSFLFMARSLGYLVGSSRGGRLFDRVPGHALMAAALFVMASMMALVPLAPALWLLAAVLLALGAAEGALDVGGNVLLVRVHGGRVGPYMNGLHFFFGVGAFLAPIIVAQVGQGIRLPYWILAVLLLPVAGWMLRLPSPNPREKTQETAGLRADSHLVALIALFLFLYVGAEVSFGGWVYTYTVALKLSGASAAAYLTSAFWGSLTLGRLLAIPFAARFRPRAVLFCDLAGCLVSVGVILLWSGSFAATVAGTVGLGLSMASIFPTTLTFAERRMKITGQVTGWFIVGASAGSMFLPWLIGELFEKTGPRATMFVIINAMLAAVGVFAVVIRSSSRLAATDQDKSS